MDQLFLLTAKIVTVADLENGKVDFLTAKASSAFSFCLLNQCVP